MILNSTTRKIQALLSGAAATTNPQVVASYTDITTTTLTPGAAVANLNGTTAVDVVSAPGASTYRKVGYLSIQNIDSAAVTVTVRYNDNGTTYKILTVTLAVNDTLQYTDTDGWRVIDDDGQIKSSASGGGGGLSDGDYGDITVGGSGTTMAIDAGAVGTAEIADDAVTYAKIQDVSATDRILGRDSSGAGVIEELTLSAVLDMIGSAAQGDILYRGASGWARLGAGTSGHFLKTQGAGANPTWDAAGGGGVSDGDKGDVTISSSGSVYVVDSAAEDFALLGDISPSISSGIFNDWNPTGLSTATVIRVTSTGGASSITGISGGADGRLLVLVNVGTNDVSLTDASGSSSAANRFENNGDITIATKQAAILLYDSTSSRWRAIARPSSGGGIGGSSGSTDNALIRADGTGGSTIQGSGTTAALDDNGLLTLTGASAGLTLATAGAGIKVKQGTNATFGTGTLSSGTATISTTKVTANSVIFLTNTSLGYLYVASISAGTSFNVASTNSLDTNTFGWWILEPS